MTNMRKQLVVDKSLQYSMIKYLVLYATSLSLIFLAILYYASNRFIEKVAMMNVEEDVMINLFNDINYMAVAFFVLILVISLLSSYFSLYFSNKIAGPIYNINRVLDDNVRDNTSRMIKLRKGDYFIDLSEKINLLIEKSKP